MEWTQGDLDERRTHAPILSFGAYGLLDRAPNLGRHDAVLPPHKRSSPHHSGSFARQGSCLPKNTLGRVRGSALCFASCASGISGLDVGAQKYVVGSMRSLLRSSVFEVSSHKKLANLLCCAWAFPAWASFEKRHCRTSRRNSCRLMVEARTTSAERGRFTSGSIFCHRG